MSIIKERVCECEKAQSNKKMSFLGVEIIYGNEKQFSGYCRIILALGCSLDSFLFNS